MRSRFSTTLYHTIISITIIVCCMLFKFCFGEKPIYSSLGSSLATTAWFEFGIRFIKARVHFWMHHLNRTYLVNHLVMYLNCCSCGSQLFQKKKHQIQRGFVWNRRFWTTLPGWGKVPWLTPGGAGVGLNRGRGCSSAVGHLLRYFNAKATCVPAKN